METFSALLAFCAWNSPVAGEFPSQRPVMRNFMFSLVGVWINGWVKNREAGVLRRHRAHYDVIVMKCNIRTHVTDISVWSVLVTLLSGECYITPLMINQHWLRWWLGAVRQHAITWANIDQDLRRPLVSLGHNALYMGTRTVWPTFCRCYKILFWLKCL